MPGWGQSLNAQRGDGVNDGDGCIGTEWDDKTTEGWGVQSGLEAGRINSDGEEGGSGKWEKGPKGLKQPPWESGRLASRLARYSPRAAHDAPL